jgi:transcriptional regulator with XRE-family HTH domain
MSDIEHDRRTPSEGLLGKLALLLELNFDELMARAGRVGDAAERYLKKHPRAVILFRRLAETGATEEQLE